METSTPVQEVTEVKAPAPVPNPAPAESLTQVTKPTPAPSLSARRAIEQDSSVLLEAQAVDKLERGYTRVPNTILMRLVNGDLTRNEIKLVLLIARFTISYQRRRAPLSKTVLERLSGLRGAAILEALAGLVSKGIVEKEQGDQHKPNLLGLVLPEGWDQPGKPHSTEPPTANPTPAGKAASVVISPAAEVGNPTGAGAQNPTGFKDKGTYPKIDSLPPLPEALREYFDGLKPAKKRESEWSAFRELQADYSAGDISDCLKLLQETGIGTGDGSQPCHSPMGYLSKAMAEVLGKVEALRQKARERQERERRTSEAERQRLDQQAREAAEWAQKERAFDKAFPSEERQREALVEQLRGLPFRPDSHTGRVAGIGRWWDRLTQYERMELTT